MEMRTLAGSQLTVSALSMGTANFGTGISPEQAFAHMDRYVELGGEEGFERFKQQLVDELNALQVDGMPKVEGLNVLSGSYINLEYTLPSGQKVKLLNDQASYLGNQLECTFGGSRCFGIAANMQFLLVCTYEENGTNPELVIYKKR